MTKTVCVAIALATATTAHAGPRDKLQASLINTDAIHGSASWDNRTVKATVTAKRCAVDVVIAKATTLAGLDLVCIWGNDAINVGNLPGGFSTLLAGTVSEKGKLKLRSDSTRFGCGLFGDLIGFNQSMECYQTTIGTEPGEYDWETACESAGMTPFPVFGEEDSDSIAGVCGGAEGQRIPPPAVAELARMGAYLP